MKKASITEAKNNLSALIDSVKGGSPVLIVDRGRPVARLEPVSGGPDDDGRLARLVRDGIVRPARRGLPKDLFTARPPRLRKGASGVRALFEERREGREMLGRMRHRPVAHDGTDDQDIAGARREGPTMIVWRATELGVRVRDCAHRTRRCA